MYMVQCLGEVELDQERARRLGGKQLEIEQVDRQETQCE